MTATAPMSHHLDETDSPALDGAIESEEASPHLASDPEPTDEDLPEVAGRDAINLFAPSPTALFLHWSHAGSPVAALRKAFGDAASQYCLVVRLFDVGADAARVFEASPAQQQWFDAQPERDYRADLGFHAEELPFINLLSSNIVRTPRMSVSPNADADTRFHITPREFEQTLAHIGYAPDVIEQMTQPDKPPPHKSQPEGTQPDKPLFEKPPFIQRSSYCHFGINAGSSGK